MQLPDNETRTRILDAAETLFSERGYAAVTLRQIGVAVGIHHASLYYYVPGGKKQLFVEVVERSLERHRTGLIEAIAAAGDDVRAQFHAIANWLASQPPFDFGRMIRGDMPAISTTDSDRLLLLAYQALRDPIVAVLEGAREKGAIEVQDMEIAASALITLVQSVHSAPFAYPEPLRLRVGQHLADMLLDGLRTR